jgi:hypothetical protein
MIVHALFAVFVTRLETARLLTAAVLWLIFL